MARVTLNGLQPTVVAALPAAASYANAIFLRSSDATLWLSDGTNWFHLSVDDAPKTDVTAASGAINSTDTYITAALAIAANQLKVGDHFRVRAYGMCTSSVANVSTFTPRIGSAGSTLDTALSTLTCTAAASGSSVPFEIELHVVVRAIGASGSLFVCGRLTNSGVTGVSSTTNVVMVGAAVTVNTTGALKLGLSYKSAASTTTSTFQQVTVEQVK